MANNTSIEWTDATPMVDRGGRRVRHYMRKRPDRPGQQERRARAAQGESWCRGCRAWLPTPDVRSGVCRPCANAEYRATYARDGAAVRAQKAARKRRLAVIPAPWREQQLTGPCAYGCGRTATTLDHIWPVALGGQSRPGNLAPACGSCNSSKKGSLPCAWVRRGFDALPDLWLDLAALAEEHGGHAWTEAA
jgi:5-methylcytosine-specific restriction endonuclease McrA